MALGVRGFNPIWVMFNLQGKLFDDTYYMFVLENTIPYIPADVYHDPDLNVVWDNPIRFLANGTLPVDIYFESDVVYRLEFRKNDGINPPSQNDPLIYEVNNYVAGDGGSGPVDTVAFASSNQVTNPQFSLISFSSLYAITNVTNPAPIEIGPGWFLDLTGTGNATITQVPLSSTTPNPSNAPYALRLTLAGWDTANLRQRFQQNGMLWADKIVSSTITARLQGSPQAINATLVDSNGTTLTNVLDNQTVNSAFNEFTGHGTLPATSNPDVPPAAYIDYVLALPTSVDIYVTSIQLVVQELPIEPSFEQDSIDRQIDHTFHYYRESLLMQPKDSLLTGWDFALNPWQNAATASTTVATQCVYTTDQTILYQQAGGSEVASGRAPAADKFAYEIKAIGSNNRFAIIQYIDPTTVSDIWGTVLSSLVRARISSPTHSTTPRFKMRLIWRTTLPATIGATQPIATWTGSADPTFAAGWTTVVPKNDPVYTLESTTETFVFEGMSLASVVPSTSTMTLGIVLYTLDPIVETATADRILFERISLVPNQFAIDSNVLSFDETLRRCMFYYESSKDLYTLLTTSGDGSALLRPQWAAQVTTTIAMFVRSFGIEFATVKRGTAAVAIYSEGGAINNVTAYTYHNAAQVATGAVPITNWTGVSQGNKGIQYVSNTSASFIPVAGTANNTSDSFISFHYAADTRLGI